MARYGKKILSALNALEYSRTNKEDNFTDLPLMDFPLLVLLFAGDDDPVLAISNALIVKKTDWIFFDNSK